MKIWKGLVFRSVLLLSLNYSWADKILFLLPIAGEGHVKMYEDLIRALGNRGHEIVNISPVKSPDMPTNVKQIQILSVDEIFGELTEMQDPFEMRKAGIWKRFINTNIGHDSVIKSCEKVVKAEDFLDALTKSTYDLVIVDILRNFCVLGALPIIQAPSIMVSTLHTPPGRIVTDDIGNRLPPSFVPDLTLSLTHRMNFLQRMQNVFFINMNSLVSDFAFLRVWESNYKENLPNGRNLPGVHEIMGNTSMFFMNSHFSLTSPIPLLPDCIEIGGIHCKPAKPLPKDMDEFLTGSGSDGFLFFNLGSTVPAKYMPEDYRRIFVNVFGRLRQRVIWNWETESMPDLPPNVLLKWGPPQQDVLGHPNMRLFMTHGELLSLQEAAYHGVPVLGFPFTCDQDMHIKQAETNGYVKMFEILELNEEKLESAISEMINNTKYAKRAKELSILVRDLPQTPLEKAIYWTEYVLRHKGALHLRSAARELNFFQYYVLDVTFAFIVINFILFAIYVKTIRACCRLQKKFRSANAKQSESEKEKLVI